MFSIGSLNLLPPQGPPPTTSAPAPTPSTSNDGSFGSALKRAQDRNSSPADDGSQAASTDSSSSKSSPSTDADPSNTNPPDGSEQTDGTSVSPESVSGKPVQPDGLKKTATGKPAAIKKQNDAVDESDEQKLADTEAADALTKEPVEATGAKQPKKSVAKPAAVKAEAGPSVTAAVAGAEVKPKKVDPSKTTGAKSSGKSPATVDAVSAGKDLKSTEGAADATADEGDSTTANGIDTAGAQAGLVGKVVWQKAYGSKTKGATGQTDSGNAAANAVAAAEAAGVSTADPDSAGSASGAGVSAIGTATASSGDENSATAALTADAAGPSGKTDAPAQAAPVAVKPTPQQQFVEDNHPKIVTGVAGELLPDGGTMQIRLDPPELGTISVTIHMKAGVMSAAFETSNDDSTRMLTHSLSQLKTSLEATGVSVEKMQVQQSPKQQDKGTGDKESGAEKQQDQQGQAKRDQQRQDLIKRMWAKLAGGDPLDLVA